MHKVAWFFSGSSFFPRCAAPVIRTRDLSHSRLDFPFRGDAGVWTAVMRSVWSNTFNFHKIGLLLWKSNWRCSFPLSFSLVWSFLCRSMFVFTRRFCCLSVWYSWWLGLFCTSIDIFMRINVEICLNRARFYAHLFRPIFSIISPFGRSEYWILIRYDSSDCNNVRRINKNVWPRWSRTLKWGKIHILSRLSGPSMTLAGWTIIVTRAIV